MLRKLIKHDFKSLSRYLILLHAFLLIIAFIGRIFVISNVQTGTPTALETLYMLTFVISLVSAAIGTSVIIGMHFYKSLYSTQGYLSWTLPVTANQHLLSKTLVGFFWAVVNMLLIWLAVVIFAFTSDAGLEAIKAGINALGSHAFPAIALTAIYFLLGLLTTLMMIYVAATIGQLFNNHRVLASVITYGFLYVISQILTTLGLVGGSQTFFFADLSDSSITVSNNLQGAILYQNVLLTSIIISIIQLVVYYCITQYIMRRKLNLS